MEQERELISKEDLLQWMEEPVSRAFIGAIKEKIKELYVELGNGRTLDISNSSVTLAETAKAVGKIEILQEVLDINIAEE
jgi:hypothetical protein